MTKADGSKEPYSREKVEKTILRMGANKNQARDVAEKIEARLYEGMPTSRILQMIFRFTQRHKPALKHLLDLRRGISVMDPKPEFETFVRILLAQNGFEVTPNQILQGSCVEHEVDAIAKKDGETFFLEVKHHFGYHTLTGLDESRIARAVLEDVTDFSPQRKKDFRVNRAMIVTNTRYSEHARRYGDCKNILQIGWDSPQDCSLQIMIEKKKLYPLSCLRGLKHETRAKLVNYGIVLIKQLNDEEPKRLAREAALPFETIKTILEKAKASLEELW